MRTRRSSLLLAGMLFSVPAVVSAQGAPPAAESPIFLPPGPQPGLGLYLVDTYLGGLGVVGIYRSPSWNWGLRFGLAEDSGDDLGIFGGIDLVSGLHRQTRDIPVDIDWLLGAFLSVGDNVLVSVPLGVTGAHTFRTEGAAFTPFLTPRLVLDVFFFEDPLTDENESEVDLDLAADLGLDLRLRGFRPVIRFAFSLGRDALGIGVVF